MGVKEQRWPTDVKYLRLSTLHGHYTHVCTVSKVVGIHTEKMSAKQLIHKWLVMIKNKYGCFMHNTYVYS